MTYREALNTCTTQLQAAGIAEQDPDAWLLLSYVTKMDRTHYYLCMDEQMPEEELTEYRLLSAKRAERIPLQYILGEQDFMGLHFHVNPGVLVPRQDTETLVEEALHHVHPGMKVMDMCTGSGCIIISILKNCPGITAYGADISKQALQVAKDNARLNDATVNFECSNLFDKVNERFDMIVCNPPYIPSEEITKLEPEVSVFEPESALDGGETGLDYYEKIIGESGDFLEPGGWLLFEIGCDQAEAVCSMMELAGYREVQCIQDYSHHDRVVCGHLE